MDDIELDMAVFDLDDTHLSTVDANLWGLPYTIRRDVVGLRLTGGFLSWIGYLIVRHVRRYRIMGRDSMPRCTMSSLSLARTRFPSS